MTILDNSASIYSLGRQPPEALKIQLKTILRIYIVTDSYGREI